ncbi:MAG: LLM class flavin-dependent oxidoreductase [Chloroflexota bacterium]
MWQAESRLAREPLVVLGAFAAATNRIKLGMGAVNIWGHNPAILAASLLTLDDLAPDRIQCGLSLWWEPLASQVGIERHRPLLAMREVTYALRELLAMHQVTMQGDYVRLSKIGLDVIHGRRIPRQVPIYMAVSGPRLAALAGEIADGVLLNYLVSPGYTTGAVEQIAVGVRQSGRTIDDVERAQLIVCSVDRDRQQAMTVARRFVTLYIRQQPQIMRTNGVPQELIDEISRILPPDPSDDQLSTAMQHVPDSIVQLVTASGTAEECRLRVNDYIRAGATYPVLYPLGNDVRYMIDVFAHGYRT